MFSEYVQWGGKTKNLVRQIFGEIQWFSRTNASASNSVFEAVKQTLHITVCMKVCGQTNNFAEPQRPPAQEVSKHDGKVYILCIILYEVG